MLYDILLWVSGYVVISWMMYVSANLDQQLSGESLGEKVISFMVVTLGTPIVCILNVISKYTLTNDKI